MFLRIRDLDTSPAGNYIFKVKNRNTRKKCEIFSLSHTSLWYLKIFYEGRFAKVLKAFIKPFEAPQRNVKINI